MGEGRRGREERGSGRRRDRRTIIVEVRIKSILFVLVVW